MADPVTLDFSKAQPLEQGGVSLDFSKAQRLDVGPPPPAAGPHVNPEFANPLPTEKIPLIGSVTQPFGEVASALRYDPKFREDTAKYGLISSGVGTSALAGPEIATGLGLAAKKIKPLALPAIGSYAINRARELPGIGPVISRIPYAEMLPWLFPGGGGAKEKPAAEETPVFSKTKLGPEIPNEVRQARGLGGFKPPEEPASVLGKIPLREPATNPSGYTLPVGYKPVTPKAMGEALETSLGGQPLKPNVPLREQLKIARPFETPAAKPISHTKVESSALSSHAYDPEADELHIRTKSNPSTTYVYGDVSQDQADAIANAPSKGKAWAEFKKSGSPLVAKIVNGERVPVKPVIAAKDLNPEGAGGPAVRINPEEDLTGKLQDSLRIAKKRKAKAGD